MLDRVKDIRKLFPGKIIKRDLSRFPPKTACWEWMGDRYPEGYGMAFYGGRMWGAHVLALYLLTGKYPAKGIHTCHRCDNKWCVNPNHLFRGTPAENYRDRIKWLVSITDEEIEYIKCSDLSDRELSRRFKVEVSVIRGIRPFKRLRQNIIGKTSF